ncbi:hypothetical protein NQ315_011585 [Exocentrus adspersus]|uniref:Peptidase S1 domain-containing protein n=1 Tax=Exocentrus adspersus TaxID=1586481 RepID=A0AAV8VV32_9CUCU|nr:hypothetical protein NQ315_011585 [Exocentrus adspersus]
MKVAVCLIAVLGCSAALPSPNAVYERLPWDQIKGENVYIEPIANYTVDQPIDGRIIGGSEVTRNSRPYQVALFINGRSFCGGSLITRNFVLTAAHCTISASYVELVFGAHNVNNQETTQLRLTSSNIINHPQYQSATLRNDVALVRTPSSVTTNNNIQIITLAAANAGTYAGSTAFLSGWGRTSDSSSGISPVLRGVSIQVITNAVCSGTYGTSIIQTSNICTSGAGVVGGCNGDSGGPLVVGNVQVGVTSFVSARGCQSGLPTGFARVSSFRTWIAQNSDL